LLAPTLTGASAFEPGGLAVAGFHAPLVIMNNAKTTNRAHPVIAGKKYFLLFIFVLLIIF